MKIKQRKGRKRGMLTFHGVTREDFFVNDSEGLKKKKSQSRAMQISKWEHSQQGQKQMQRQEAEVYFVYYRRQKEANDAGAEGAR